MGPNIKAQWVAALRSGEYRQGKNVLHNVDTDKYCCLGVLCALAVKAGVIDEGSREYSSDAVGDIEVYGAEGNRYAKGGVSLPAEVVDWAGVGSDNPAAYIDNDDYPRDLAALNDDYGYTFEQLAGLIEEQL